MIVIRRIINMTTLMDNPQAVEAEIMSMREEAGEDFDFLGSNRDMEAFELKLQGMVLEEGEDREAAAELMAWDGYTTGTPEKSS